MVGAMGVFGGRPVTTRFHPGIAKLVWSMAAFGVVIAQAAASEKREDRFISNTRQLTYEGERNGEQYFSPDGKLLIFMGEREPGNPFFQIYILNLETGDCHRVSPGKGKATCPYFRPGTEMIEFASTHLDPEFATKAAAEYERRASGRKKHGPWDYDEHYDIFTCRRDGSELTRLTDATGYDAEGAYSPDGKLIVFCSLRDAYPLEKLSAAERKQMDKDASYFGELYIMNADGTNQRRLTDWPGYDGGPFFSPDGERIIWRHFEPNGLLADIYTMRIDGTDRRRLTDFECMSWAPFYHPSGEYAVFNSNKLGFSNFELFIVDAEGRHEPVQVTYADGFDGLAVFSPDGRQIVWVSNLTADGKSQIFVGDWDHGGAMAALGDSPLRDGGEVAAAAAGEATDPDPAPSQAAAASQTLSPEILAGDLWTHVEYLASDELEGRMTGSAGARKAADYIAARFAEIGLKPAGDDGTFFQEFPFTSGVELVAGANRLSVVTEAAPEGRVLELDKDFRPLAFSADGEVEAELVFAGYGLVVPGEGDEGYDSYAGLEVVDKIVLALRYVPEAISPERRRAMNLYRAERYKAVQARERGAKAILFVAGPSSPGAGELIPLSGGPQVSSAGIVAASISGSVAESLLAGSGKALKDLQAALDAAATDPAAGFALPTVRVRVSAGIEKQKGTGRNVVGLLRSVGAGQDSYVMAGAHYDHIGHGEGGGSLARAGEESQIHNGADDNASGTATVLELAAAMAEADKGAGAETRRGAIFACWSGEELGVIGSSHFAAHPTVPLEKIVAYLNFDMVGHYGDEGHKLIVQAVGSSPTWRGLLEKKNVVAGLQLALQSDPYLPTDSTSFYLKGIAGLTFFTGAHEDYNRPTDDADTLNYEGLERVARLGELLLRDLVSREEAPAYAKVESKSPPGGGRTSMRLYTGTVPDFTAGDVKGFKLAGVRAGGPADKAGLTGGDVIVEFAGQKVENIEDYMYALESVKAGEPVEVVVDRGGQRVRLSITPEWRK